jgi:hydroxymethylbilane synthase
MKPLRIGTRDSQLAVWQATTVQNLLKEAGVESELVYMKSEGDVDLVTPLYAMGVTGVFTKTLDAALLNNRIDIAVHSMKDVPVQLAQGIRQAAVLKRGSYKDILVHKGETGFLEEKESAATIATGSVRRIAQWRHRYPNHQTENLRGNVNTRLRKLEESNWNGAIFAAAGLERIGLRPYNAVDLDWMLPAPAQGAIMVVCRAGDDFVFESCQSFNDETTALCTKLEKDFLRVLMGGCSTPISALAQLEGNEVLFEGNVCAPDGSLLVPVQLRKPIADSETMGEEAGNKLLQDPRVQEIIKLVRDAKA